MQAQLENWRPRKMCLRPLAQRPDLLQAVVDQLRRFDHSQHCLYR